MLSVGFLVQYISQQCPHMLPSLFNTTKSTESGSVQKALKGEPKLSSLAAYDSELNDADVQTTDRKLK